MNRFLWILSSLVITFSAYAGNVDAILKKFPGRDQKSVTAACVELVKSGPIAIKTLCGKLVANQPKVDVKVRYALNGVVMHVTRPQAEAERAMVTKALCDALPTLKSDEAKTFVILQLERCGKNDAIPALTPFVTSATLCESTIHTLVRIATPEADRVLANALKSATGIPRIKIIHALGARRHAPSGPAMLKLAKNADAKVRDAALDALASIGAAGAAPLVIATSKGLKGGKLTHAIARCQRLGKRLVDAGKDAEAATLFRYILKLTSESKDLSSGWTCVALDGLVMAQGDKAAGDLIKAIPTVADNRVAYKISSLALTLPSADRVHAALAKENVFYKYRLLCHKASKGDKASEGALLKALIDDAANRDRTYTLARQMDKGKVADALITLMAKDGKKVVPWALEIPGKVLHPKMLATWKQANKAQRLAYAEIATIRRSLDFEDVLMTDLDHSDAAVRSAAGKALGKMESAKVVAKLSSGYTKAATRKERVKALRIIADFCKKSGNVTALTALMTTADAHKEIFPFLASIGGKAALAKTSQSMTDKNPAIKEAATRALLKWQSAEGIPKLLKLAKETSSLKFNVMAIGSIARLAPTERGTKGLISLNNAYAAAKRADEKKVIDSARFNLVMSRQVRNRLKGNDSKLVQNVYSATSGTQKEKIKKKFGKLLK